ncbi:transposase [bacterium]|nr:transposase [bacterium]
MVQKLQAGQIHAQEDKPAAVAKGVDVIENLRVMKLVKAAVLVAESLTEMLSYTREHWRRIQTNNPLERIMKEIRRRTRVVGEFPDGDSAKLLVAARLRHIAGTKWNTTISEYHKTQRTLAGSNRAVGWIKCDAAIDSSLIRELSINPARSRRPSRSMCA